MIESVAKAAAALKQARYTDAAIRAADFVLSELVQDGRLMRYWRDGKVVEKAYLEDYASMGLAAIALYEATFDSKWLNRAAKFADDMIDLFEDFEQGGFFLKGNDTEQLITSPKPSYDGAVPSGNSIAAELLLRLGQITLNQSYTQKAAGIFRHFSKRINDYPTSLTQMLSAMNFWFGPIRQVVIAEGKDREKMHEMLDKLRASFSPSTIVLLNDIETQKISPFIKEQKPVDKKTTAYICEDFVCKQPITELSEFEAIIS